MEVSIFPLPEVRPLKGQFVEARLHSDTKDPVLNARIAGLIETVAKSPAQPIYVAMDPQTEKEVGRFEGAVLPGQSQKFVDFLEYVITELQ
ncbi:hypothetical protein Poly30_56050 [Planctomycetes bacterium Poly30]|uniref:Uncharacterized protein n=1 Tax=Saltatorellus ferox TaxID=2528018 RepID=A0A518F129_9BACT|nr:hypothetical protein Poly30_56050 [Planctomycetes bacterium Poly30]